MPTETQAKYLLHEPTFQKKSVDAAQYFDCALLQPGIVFEALEHAYKQYLTATYNKSVANRLKKAFDRTQGVIREAIKSSIVERKINTSPIQATQAGLLDGSLSKVLQNVIAQDLLGNTQVPGIVNSSSVESRTVAAQKIIIKMQVLIQELETKQLQTVETQSKLTGSIIGLLLIASLVVSTCAVGEIDVSVYGTLENQAEDMLRKNETYHQEIIAFLQSQGIPAVAIDTDRRDAGLNVQVVGEIQSGEDYKFRMVSVLVTYLDEAGEANKTVLQIPVILNQSQQTDTSD